MIAGSIADRVGFADTFEVVETGLLMFFCGSEWQHVEVVTSEVSIEAVFKLLCCAEDVHHAKVVNLCGAYMGVPVSPLIKAMAFSAAMMKYRREYFTFPSSSCRVSILNVNLSCWGFVVVGRTKHQPRLPKLAQREAWYWPGP